MKALIALQNMLIAVSVLFLIAFPVLSLFVDFGFEFKEPFYAASFTALAFVMLVRPLADIFSGQLWLRKLIFLRKGFGILSASIIIGFMIASVIAPESAYRASFFTADFWSLDDYVFFAHVGDISGLILLITSNRLSQKLLKQNWKRVQRLSYVYFYAGGIYHAFALGSMPALYIVLLVTNLTILAWAIKFDRRMSAASMSEAGKTA